MNRSGAHRHTLNHEFTDPASIFQILGFLSGVPLSLGASLNASYYSLHPEIPVGETDVSRRILVLDTFIFTNFYNK